MLYLLCLAFLLEGTNDHTFRAVALEGGGSHGAYEAGAIWAMANLSNPVDVTWNVVSGISTGALNSLAILQFPMGQEIPMSEYMLNIWLSLNGSSSVYKQWAGGEIDGLLFHSSIYDTAPLIETLRNDFKYGIQRNVTVGSTNLDTGYFYTFNEDLGDAILDGIISSASPPFFFPPHQFEGYSWADGGCIINLDVFSAVERCLEITTESNIIVDIIFDNQYTLLPDETAFKTLEVFARIYHIHSYDSSIWYTYNAMVAYPKVYYRYIVHPSQPMPGGIVPLNFSKTVLEAEIQMGINDTTAVIKEQKSGQTIIQELYKANLEKIFYP